MSELEKRLQKQVPKAASILRGMREKAGIIDDKGDEEICSLQEIYNVYEALMTQKYIEDKQQLIEELADVRDLANP